MHDESRYDSFIDFFITSMDDDEPYGLLPPEAYMPEDVQSAWSSSPPPLDIVLPENW
jgi:hypothetical protein